MFLYLVKSKGPDRVGGQLHRVQQSDLDEAVGLCATCWPVLVTLHLQVKRDTVTDAEYLSTCLCTIL